MTSRMFYQIRFLKAIQHVFCGFGIHLLKTNFEILHPSKLEGLTISISQWFVSSVGNSDHRAKTFFIRRPSDGHPFRFAVVINYEVRVFTGRDCTGSFFSVRAHNFFLGAFFLNFNSVTADISEKNFEEKYLEIFMEVKK